MPHARSTFPETGLHLTDRTTAAAAGASATATGKR
jgi:hypothetical protein